MIAAEQVMLAQAARKTAQLARTEACTIDELLRDFAEARGVTADAVQAEYDQGAALLEDYGLAYSASFPEGATDPAAAALSQFQADYPQIVSEVAMERGDRRCLYLALIPALRQN